MGHRDSQDSEGLAAAGQGHGGQASVPALQPPMLWAVAGLWAELPGHSWEGGHCQQQEQCTHGACHQVHGEAGLAAVAWDAELRCSCGSCCVTVVLPMSQWSFSCHCSNARVTVVLADIRACTKPEFGRCCHQVTLSQSHQSAEWCNGLAWKGPKG